MIELYLAPSGQNSHDNLYIATEKYLRKVLPFEESSHLNFSRDTCPLSFSSKGKPFFAAIPNLHFSISHSYEWWGCAFSDSPLGFDLQKNVLKNSHSMSLDSGDSKDASVSTLLRLAERYFHPEEASYVKSPSDNSEIIKRYFEIWSAKESYVKYLGTGINGSFSKFSVLPDSSSFCQVETEIFSGDGHESSPLKSWSALHANFLLMDEFTDYTLCLCSGENTAPISVNITHLSE